MDIFFIRFGRYEFEIIAFVSDDPVFLHDFKQMLSYGRGGVNDFDRSFGGEFLCDFPDRVDKERVVGAAEDNTVRAFVEKGFQACPDDVFCFFTACIHTFHQLYESLPDVLGYLDSLGVFPSGYQILVSLESACCGEDSDDSGLCAQGCRLDCGLHSDELYRVFLAEGCDCRGCRCVAGDDDDVRSSADEEICDGAGPVDYVFLGFFSVRAMGIVRIIDVPLFRKYLAYFLENGQAADA